jgi:hypothetical protein
MPFTFLCAHIDGREWCSAGATHSKYGMDRCDDHEIDLSPCMWEGNVDESGHCQIDHVRSADIYGPTCRNPHPTATA